MKLLYDHQIFTRQDYGGISRYFCEMMSQFVSDPEIEFRLALRCSQNEHLHQHPELNRLWTRRNNFFSDSHFFSTIQKKMRVNVLKHLFGDKRESVRQLKSQNFDLFHPTYYDPYFIKYWRNKPYVLTIHDMIHEKFPDLISKYDLTKNRKKLLAKNARQIIAVSSNTKEDIINILKIPEDKIHVIFHADSICRTDRANSNNQTVPEGLPQDYLLFVGNRTVYKNFTFLLSELAPVLEANPDLYLVCSGGGSFTSSEEQRIRAMNITARVIQVPADDATLLYLYKNARAFIFPSLYEGFGIPVLEAFSCGCPALLSNTSSLPEVGGDSAMYFDPTVRNSLTSAIDQIITDESLRKDLIMRGYTRSRLFSWEKTAAMTKKVYEMATE